MLQRTRRAGFPLLLTFLVGLAALTGDQSASAQKKPNNKKKAAPPPVNKPIAPPPPKSSLLTHEAWQKAQLTPVQPGEIDDLVAKEQAGSKVEPAPLTTDEQFLRRVTLDLTGQLPLPADVEEFAADQDPNKRVKLIDKLLASEEYARHWAYYWREVFTARINDPRGKALLGPFEAWLVHQFQSNRSWEQIARDLLTAEGPCRFDDEGENGAVFFLASHRGPDAASEQAAEASRIFLGIQIQCAQCHDHKTDQWKRVQFHELAGYFARVRERPLKGDGKGPAGIELFSLPRGEHEMPSMEDPKKTFVTPPRFLDGKAPGPNLGDKERRKALANAMVDKSNYWFAGAFVNRMWGELMGQSFYEPVDDMGPNREAVFPSVLTRVTGAFRGSNYDVKALLRAILNTKTYQRQIRLGEATDAHLHFAAAYPTRLHPDALWDSLVSVLGQFGAPPAAQNPQAAKMAARFGFRPGLEGAFKNEFSFDPSLKADEIEGSIPQALLLMNNPAINQRILARGTNLLARILSAYPNDDDALRMVYLRTLARKPTDKERQKCLSYLAKVEKRAEAFEDILWVLLNSTEFQTKR
jgi:hypothetical protein